jgi:hypothetical protein
VIHVPVLLLLLLAVQTSQVIHQTAQLSLAHAPLLLLPLQPEQQQSAWL